MDQATVNELAELSYLCRIGDVEGVEQKIIDGANVNARDAWDATPLYYACLTGQIEVVRFLLKAGAICDVNTFDGERCYISALTLEVRTALEEYGDRVRVSRGDRFYRFVTALRGDLSHADFYLYGEDSEEKIHLHTAIFAARSPCHRTFLTDFIYKGSLDVLDEDLQDLQEFGSTTGLTSLMRLIELGVQRRKFNRLHGNEDGQLILADDLSREEVREDFADLVRRCVEATSDSEVHADTVVITDERRIFCHKLFLNRCEYFRGMEHFNESMSDVEHSQSYESTGAVLEHVDLNEIAGEAFCALLWMLYTDKFYPDAGDDLALAVDVLSLCDMLLAPAHCVDDIEGALVRRQFQEDEDRSTPVLDLLKIAEIFSLHQLQAATVKYVSERIWDENLESFRADLAKVVEVVEREFLLVFFEDVREESLRRMLNDVEESGREDAAGLLDEHLEELFGSEYAEFAVEYNKDA